MQEKAWLVYEPVCAQENYCKKAITAKNPSFARLFCSPQPGQTAAAGPWLLSGVKAEPGQAAEPR